MVASAGPSVLLSARGPDRGRPEFMTHWVSLSSNCSGGSFSSKPLVAVPCGGRDLCTAISGLVVICHPSTEKKNKHCFRTESDVSSWSKNKPTFSLDFQ